jgi:1-deoxy-D-xylulose-5-phosphate reductoisomerase
MKPKNLLILGSTGSIGSQTLDLVREHREDYSVFALVAHQRVDRMASQCLEFKPRYACLKDDKASAKLQGMLSSSGADTEVVPYSRVLELCADDHVDTVVAAIVGSAGLLPTLTAARSGKRVLLANKEALVMSGSLLMQTVAENGATILPVDSEHNAIFQALPNDFYPGKSLPDTVESLVLTASGGPFLKRSLPTFSSITPQEAVKHPNWSMGAKISVDSASMMNKVLELIEAHYLFSLPADRIETVIHPQSIIHSMVRYKDGSIIAQLGVPDMRVPIAHCMAWPDRMKTSVPRFDFMSGTHLTFGDICTERFPCFQFARSVIDEGQAAMIALNAANEVAVEGFLQGRIQFTDIPSVIDTVLQKMPLVTIDSLEQVVNLSEQSMRCANDVLSKKNL